MKWIRRGLHTNFLYKLGQIGVSIGMNGYNKEAVLYSLKETEKAFTGNKPVIWCSTFVPPELIYSLDAVPFMPEVAAGFSATVGLADSILSLAEKEWLSSDLCSIHRCGTALMRENLLPEPDMIIAATHLCDGAKKYLQNISRGYDCPYYLLETPYFKEDRYQLAADIKELVNKLGGNNIDFRDVFTLSNKAYSYHQKVNKLRKSIPAPFFGEKALNYVPMEFMSFGSGGGVKFYKELAGTLQEKVNNSEGVVPEEKYRLLWLHLKPYYPQNIFRTLRKAGAVIAFEEYSQLYWSPLDPEKPYLSLARKMIDHFGWGPLSDQLQALLQLIDEYDIDGVIGFSHWGCRQSSGRMNLIKKKLKERGIPFLNIDGDLIDSRNYREGQLITRLEAYLEMIEAQKGEDYADCWY
ncbi:MAG: 2-hydroxyacyl-CoA dehydratase subunit D [Halanaerobiaceae bacterium]